MSNTTLNSKHFFTVGLIIGIAVLPHLARVQEEGLPVYLRDRGTGVPSSMFGTYIRPGELLVYPYFEYYLDDDMEYAPNELGYELDEDFRGKFRGYEGLIFLGYGLTDWLEVGVQVPYLFLMPRPADEDDVDGLSDMTLSVSVPLPSEPPFLASASLGVSPSMATSSRFRSDSKAR